MTIYERLALLFHSFNELREKIDLKDNLFLDRYAQSVTENGETINANDTGVTGYGVWRLTEEDFVYILSASRKQNFRHGNLSVTTNLFTNIDNGCGVIANLTESIELAELLNIVNFEPCVSAISLVTLLEIDGNHPVPVNFEEQEQLLSEVSEQIIIDFQAWNQRKGRGKSDINSDKLKLLGFLIYRIFVLLASMTFQKISTKY